MAHGSVIVGATSLEQLKHNLDAFLLPAAAMSEEIEREINAVHLRCREARAPAYKRVLCGAASGVAHNVSEIIERNKASALCLSAAYIAFFACELLFTLPSFQIAIGVLVPPQPSLC